MAEGFAGGLVHCDNLAKRLVHCDNMSEFVAINIYGFELVILSRFKNSRFSTDFMVDDSAFKKMFHLLSYHCAKISSKNSRSEITL